MGGRHRDGHQDGLEIGDWAFIGILVLLVVLKLDEILQVLNQILEKL